jgi:hypothetical protein
MNRFTYRAYYEFNGPSRDDPFRSEKTTDEAAEALSRFPLELEHFVESGSIVEVPLSTRDSNSSFVTVVTPANEAQVDEAVKRCLNGLDLFAQKISGSSQPHRDTLASRSQR